MQTKPQNYREYFLSLAVLHYAMIAGPFILGVIFTWSSMSGPDSPESINEPDQFLKYIVPALVTIGMVVSYLYNKKQINLIKYKPELKDKLIGYQSLVIVRNAVLEAPALVALIGYLLWFNYLYLYYAAACILLILINTPTKNRVISELELSFEETELMKTNNDLM